jgi:uncharacterized protein YecE (DUF72 family)
MRGARILERGKVAEAAAGTGWVPNSSQQNELNAESPIRVGCAGWAIPRSADLRFPPAPSHLERYAGALNACEINSSFYRPHKIATWQRWAASVPADFKFSVKVPKEITHEKRLEPAPAAIGEFMAQVRHLGEKLGPLLIQLPPSLKFDAENAATFFAAFRSQHEGDIVCEPRHVTWFTDSADRVLQKFGVGRVAADPACCDIAKAPGGAPAVAYFRLHGSPRTYYSSYSEELLSELSIQLKGLSAASRVWCMFDNTALGAASENAMQLLAKLAKLDLNQTSRQR